MTSVSDTVEALKAGALAVIPTDTVYGLAASLSDDPITRIFEAKGRPETKPLPVLVASMEDAERVAVLDERARRLAERFWPGPLTLVLARARGFDVDLGGDEYRTVAVRVPEDPLALQLLNETGPLAVTSANRSGEEPVGSVAEAREVFGDRVGAYLDGGPCTGLPSTVLSLTGETKTLRQGALSADLIAQTLSE